MTASAFLRVAQSPEFHTASCSGQHFQRFGLALINSEQILALCSESDSWQTDTRFYTVFSENIPFLPKHSASIISCTPQDCSLFCGESAPAVCFKSLARDDIEASPPKSKVSTHHPAFQVLFVQLSWLIWLLPMLRNAILRQVCPAVGSLLEPTKTYLAHCKVHVAGTKWHMRFLTFPAPITFSAA